MVYLLSWLLATMLLTPAIYWTRLTCQVQLQAHEIDQFSTIAKGVIVVSHSPTRFNIVICILATVQPGFVTCSLTSIIHIIAGFGKAEFNTYHDVLLVVVSCTIDCFRGGCTSWRNDRDHASRVIILYYKYPMVNELQIYKDELSIALGVT
jgi:hypothetical protein